MSCYYAVVLRSQVCSAINIILNFANDVKPDGVVRNIVRNIVLNIVRNIGEQVSAREVTLDHAPIPRSTREAAPQVIVDHGAQTGATNAHTRCLAIPLARFPCLSRSNTIRYVGQG